MNSKQSLGVGVGVGAMVASIIFIIVMYVILPATSKADVCKERHILPLLPNTSLKACPGETCLPFIDGNWEFVRLGTSPVRSLADKKNAQVKFVLDPSGYLQNPTMSFSQGSALFKPGSITTPYGANPTFPTLVQAFTAAYGDMYDSDFFNAPRTWYRANSTRSGNPVEQRLQIAVRRVNESQLEVLVVFSVKQGLSADDNYSFESNEETSKTSGNEGIGMFYLDTKTDCVQLPGVGLKALTTKGEWNVGLRPLPHQNTPWNLRVVPVGGRVV